MLKNYFKIALRNLLKYKAYSLTNLAGLILGIVCFLLIFMYITDESSYDEYHSNASRIFRVTTEADFNGVVEASSSCPFPFAKAISESFPEHIENSARLFNFQQPATLVEAEGKTYMEKGFYFADPSFFDIFDITFITEKPDSQLYQPFTVIIDESTAERYFGDENPVGKTIYSNERIEYTVSAVMQNLPAQTHFNFNFLASFVSVDKIYNGYNKKNWVWNPCWTYLLLKSEKDQQELASKFPKFVEDHRTPEDQSEKGLFLQPLNKIHLTTDLLYEMQPGINGDYLYNLMAIAILILLLVSINYMNLATAYTIRRAKEIAIKKILGASRVQLIFQLLLEAIILTFISFLISIGIIEIILPVFNDYTAKELSIEMLFSLKNIALIISFIIFVGLLSGLYPSFSLSMFKPSDAHKGILQRKFKFLFARKTLVIIQLAISATLLVCTAFIFMQINFMKNKELGFHRENIVVIPINDSRIIIQFDNFIEELRKLDGIRCATASDYIIGVDHNYHEYRHEGVKETVWQYYPTLLIRHDFLETFEIEIVEGVGFDKNNPLSPWESVMINEAMANHLGWTPDEAIGKKFFSMGGREKVIGVFKDFHSRSLHTEPQPFVLNNKESGKTYWTRYLLVRIDDGSNQLVIPEIQTLWGKYEPNRPFEYSYLEDELKRLYKDEDNLAKLSILFTIITIILAFIGLFGLVSFLAQQKTKEIGIRKVLGASSIDIIKLISAEFVLLSTISLVIAWTASYFIVDWWLGTFVEHIKIQFWIFLFAGVLILFISCLISVLKTIQASGTNPIDSLKSE